MMTAVVLAAMFLAPCTLLAAVCLIRPLVLDPINDRRVARHLARKGMSMYLNHITGRPAATDPGPVVTIELTNGVLRQARPLYSWSGRTGRLELRGALAAACGGGFYPASAIVRILSEGTI
jgi:hypothetical protein